MEQQLDVDGGRDLAAGDHTADQAPVDVGPRGEGGHAADFGQAELTGHRRGEAGQDAAAPFGLRGLLEADEREEIPTQAARVGQVVDVDRGVVEATDGVDDQVGLGRPAAVDGGLPGPGAARDLVDGHRLVAKLGEEVQGGLEDRRVARGVAAATATRGRLLGLDAACP